MSILSVTNVSHGFGERKILKNVTFRLNAGEHIGLIGNNGEGKSTFINIILKQLTPDEGKIEWAKRSKVGYLDQYTKLTPNMTIMDVLRDAFKYMFDLEKEMNENYEKMCDCDEKTMNDLLEDIGEIQTILDQSGFYLIDSKIVEVANGLGIPSDMLDKDVSELSGGQRSKVLLTKLLLENPNILVLDEPTNFLDEGQVRWLKNYLLNFENSFILISHDMEFLNSVINVVYHLEDGVMTRYSGNYEFFKANYEMKKMQQNAAYEAQQREIRNMEDVIARNKARVSTRGLASSLQKRLDRMEVIEKASEKTKPHFNFKYANVAPGKVVYTLNDLVIGYDKALTTPINLEIKRGEKIAITGINGVGKSTFIKTLIGQQKPISGSIKVSDNTLIGYYKQEEQVERKTAFNEIHDEFPYLNIGEVKGALAACGLTYQHVDSLMIALSGGEVSKVRLCRLTILANNVLVLDEPTNHLDVLAKEALKEAIQAYPGTVLLVSHEREFYSEVATSTINIEEYRIF